MSRQSGLVETHAKFGLNWVLFWRIATTKISSNIVIMSQSKSAEASFAANVIMMLMLADVVTG